MFRGGGVYWDAGPRGLRLFGRRQKTGGERDSLLVSLEFGESWRVFFTGLI